MHTSLVSIATLSSLGGKLTSRAVISLGSETYESIIVIVKIIFSVCTSTYYKRKHIVMEYLAETARNFEIYQV